MESKSVKGWNDGEEEGLGHAEVDLMVEVLVRVVGVYHQVVLDGRHVRHKVGDTVGVRLPAVVAQLADVP